MENHRIHLHLSSGHYRRFLFRHLGLDSRIRHTISYSGKYDSTIGRSLLNRIQSIHCLSTQTACMGYPLHFDQPCHSHARGKQRYRKSSQYPDARSFPHSHYFLHTLHIPPRILRRNEFPFQARFLQNYPQCRTEGNGTGIFLDECRHGYTHHIRLILFKRNASCTGCRNRRDFRHPRGHTRRHHHFPYGIYIRHQSFSGT